MYDCGRSPYEQEREWALQEFLSARHNGQSNEINEGRADALAQVERAAHWRPAHKKAEEPKKYSPARPVSWIRENANRKADARKRIHGALEGLKKLRRSFTTVELQEAAECSRRTLYDHADIWRKDYEDLASGFFAFCTDEYNVAVGADSSAIKPPTATLTKITPPGLLAARRIVYEISMRSIRDVRDARKQADTLRLTSEKHWSEKVKMLTSELPDALSIERIKALLIVLTNYLGLAPTEEDQIKLHSYIRKLKERLAQTALGPKTLPADYG